MNFDFITSRIGELDQSAMRTARARQEILTKPPGSLGRLEEISIHIAGITGNPRPKIEKKIVLVMVGDHGVTAEGVSAYPQEVTPQMVKNFLNGGAAINVLARHAGARVLVVDMGVASVLDPNTDLIVRKVAPGTQNIARGPGMTRDQAIQSILAGIQIVDDLVEQGIDILATGDMGIGNTTPSTAIAAAFTGLPVLEIVGRGTGVDDSGLDRKVRSIQSALEINLPDDQDGLDVLTKIGGFEIGGIAGVVLGAASHKIPVVIDGIISTAAAMIAVSMAPRVRDFLIAAHISQEPGHHHMLEWLRITPLLDLQMRLGEGTGAALAISMVEAACKILNEMATFDEAGVSKKADHDL